MKIFLRKFLMLDVRLNSQKVLNSKPEYPFIGRCDNEKGWYIVLFRESCVGTVIATTHPNWVIGETCTNFTMANFTPLPPNEKVVLRNKN